MTVAPTLVAFGELLLRLDAPCWERLVQARSLDVSFTGGEANVAVAIAQWGVNSRIVSRVPVHELGTACINQFRRYGVDTRFVLRGGERLGTLYVETGASQRQSKVIYDRLHTAFRDVDPHEFDWPRVLDGATWFHFTGTAPALGEGVCESLLAGLHEARRRGIPVSFDSSYRSALWSIVEAGEAFRSLMPLVDVFLGSASDARQFFEIDADGESALVRLRDRYNLRCVAFTDRQVRKTGINAYSALVAVGTEIHRSRVHEIDVVDRIGAGDAFAAGIIRGLLQGESLAAMTEQAVAAAVLTHTIPGDFALVSWDEVQALANSQPGPHSGRGWR